MKQSLLSRINRYLPWPLILTTIILIWMLVKINPDRTFTGDGLTKLIQAKSLLHSGFSSENLYYPAAINSTDTDYNYYPFPYPFQIQLDGRNLGPFPVLLSAMGAALLYFINPGSLTIITIIAYIASVLLLYYAWLRHYKGNFILLLAALGTYPIIQSLFWTDTIFTHSLAFAGFTLWLVPGHRISVHNWNMESAHIPIDNSTLNQRVAPGQALLGSFLLGLAAWLRIEICLMVAILWLVLFWQGGLKQSIKSKYFYFSGAGFAIMMLAFFIFSQLDYGHPLGLRYLGAVREAGAEVNREIGADHRLQIINTLLFIGDFRPGFFLYIPLALIALIIGWLPRFRKQFNQAESALLIACTVFIPMVALMAPNDGNADWGPRYLIAIVFPVVILINACWNILKNTNFFQWPKLLKSFIYSLAVISFVFTLLGMQILLLASRSLGSFQEDFIKREAPVWVFRNPMLTQYVGLHYFDHTVLLVPEVSQIQALGSALTKNQQGSEIIYFQSQPSPQEKEFLKDYDIELPQDEDEYLNQLQTHLRLIDTQQFKNVKAYVFKTRQ